MGASQHTMSQQLLFYVPGERGVKTLGMIGVVCRKCAFGSWLNLSGRRAETLVLLFDEVDLDLELPALIDPDDLLQGELFDTGPPQAPLQQVANRLDGEYKFTGSLQHATSLRLVHCKVLYSGEVPTHSLLELERLRSHVSSRCKAAETVVFKVSLIKKPV